jgi:cell division protein FtsI (penicillin-binding protein 3)
MNSKSKIYITFFLISLGFITILIRALYIQVIGRENLKKYSDSQIVRELKIYPNRGDILDRNNNPLAININTYSVFIMPKELKDKKRTVKKINKILKNIDTSNLLNKLHKRTRFTWVARKVELDKKTLNKLSALDGVYIDKVPKRFYPNNELASQLLGYVGVDNKGLAGVEFELDNDLRGKVKKIKYIKDAKGRAIKYENLDRNKSSQDIILSIDKDFQAFVEQTLKEGIEKFRAESGGIGVMDVETGELLAMANYPSFNPNKIEKSDIPFMKIPFISDPFEPGSVFKTFTIASALENAVADKSTNYYCERGKLNVSGHIINEAESKKTYEWLSVQEILRYSSNIGTTKIAFDLGLSKLKRTLEDFNIDQKTGVELPGESRGIFKYDDNTSPIRLSNLSFGQGIATTGIQILSAYAAIANDGVYQRPTIIKGGSSGQKGKRVLTSEVATAIEEMLVDAVYNGTGANAQVKHFQIAGKTSTAQKPSSKGGYEGYIPAFVGYPTNIDKRFVIYVYLDSPKSPIYYGNLVAAPIFRKISQYILFKDKDYYRFALNKENQLKDKVKKIQSSSIRYKKGVVPNLLGLDRQTINLFAIKNNIDIEYKGFGIAVGQNPKVGHRQGGIRKITIEMARPSFE